MKWNWGKGLVLGMVLFMGFILYFVITMSTDKTYKHDLVTEEYYAKEMRYQQEIDAETNVRNMQTQIISKRTEKGWLLRFPSTWETNKIQGKVFLYRPSNQRLDYDLPIVLSGSDLLIPDKNLVDGRWNIILEWTYDGVSYLYKEEMIY
ncbi:FixH family protein [Spongiimicrobium salis]|uniref:FixH family protein n=1 Tax=Spongiimicrobium salis TaxID=1667022 RepID=UPI00374DE544